MHKTKKNAGSYKITRRTFIGASILGSALALPRRMLSHAAVDDSASIAKIGQQALDLTEATIIGLQRGMQAGQYTSRQLVEKYLVRIKELNQRGPTLNHVLEINPDALAIADALDKERKANRLRGSLHGIPVLIKDNIDTADPMMTTAGSLALVASTSSTLSKTPVQRDAFLVQHLRSAGAIILGKTNLSEWANFRSTHASSGWSGRGHQCRNPYALDRTPSGSSSGSAVAVAANCCVVAIGTETDGSILSPSAANSIVGIKPTVGLVSRAGIIPIAHSQDTAGPMARTVADAALLLSVITGLDARDTATRESRGQASNDYTKFLNPDGLRGARIGVARQKFFGYSPAADHLIEVALDVMKKHGAVIIDPANIQTAGQFDDTEFEVLLYEFKADLNKYLAQLAGHAPVRTLRDIIEFNDRNREREMPYFRQEIFLMAEKKGPLSEEKYRKALARNHELARARGIDATLAKYKLDALVAPTGGPPAPIDLVNGDPSSGSSTTPAAVAGYPSITVPAGYVFGLPVGISFIGRAYSEPMLIKLAYAYEQATEHRRPPQFLSSAPVQDAIKATAR